MDRILREMGWIQVGTDLSGIFQKNHCYFVMYPQEQKPLILSNSQKRLGVGAELMVHSMNKSWYVEKDGFFIESGSIGRFVPASFEYGFTGFDYDRTIDFAKQINRFAEMDEEVLLRHKKKEQRTLVQGEEQSSLVLSDKRLAETHMFIANLKANPKIVKVFDEGTVYEIIDMQGNEVTIADQGHTTSGKVELSLLNKLEEERVLCSVAIVKSAKQKEVWNYDSVVQGEQSSIPKEFSDFQLGAAQEAVLAAAMDAGVNFTVLLNQNLSVETMKTLLTVLRYNVDCLSLAGKSISLEHAAFLAGIAENHYPVNGFCDTSEPVASMKERYSQFLEGLDYSLGQFKVSGEEATDIRRIAFRMRGYQEAITSGYSGAKLYLVDMCKDKRFSRLAAFMLENGISSNNRKISCPWVSVPKDMQILIKNIFYAEGLSVEGLNWNHYLEDSINRAEFITFSEEKGFQICFRMLKIGTDANSIFLSDSTDTVVWRSVFVNEKYYVYRSDLVTALL